MREEIIKINENSVIKIEESEFKGKPYIGIRKYFYDSKNWLPTKKGIMLTKKQAEELNIILSELLKGGEK